MSQKFYIFAVVFAVVYAVAYVIAVESNYALLTYHPAIEEWGWLVEKPRDGPAMYWYGWMATAALIGTVIGLSASLLPARTVQALWPGWSWSAPLAAMAFFSYLLRGFFLG